MLDFLVEDDLLDEEEALVTTKACLKVVFLTEVVAFFVEEEIFFVDEVTFFVEEAFFAELVVFFAAATEDDEADAWIHLQALLTWATLKPLTVDVECLLESHDLQYGTGCLLLFLTVLTSLALQAACGQWMDSLLPLTATYL